MTRVSDEIITAVGSHFKCGGLFNIDQSTRSSIANHLSAIVNTLGAFPSKVGGSGYEGVLPTLRRQGIVMLPDFVPKVTIDRINAYFADRPGFQAHVPIYARTPELLVKAQAEAANIPILSFTPDLSLSCPDPFEIFVDERLLTIASMYLECFPTLYDINTYYSFPCPVIDRLAQSDHRDNDCFRFLACFVYLSDVDNLSGPFVYYPGTHLRDSKDRQSDCMPHVVCAPAGSIIIADTWGFHRGEPPRAHHRFASWWRYGLGLAGGYFQNQCWRYKLDAKALLGGHPDRPDLHHLLRGFLADPPA
jgi:hypothetical protein